MAGCLYSMMRKAECLGMTGLLLGLGLTGCGKKAESAASEPTAQAAPTDRAQSNSSAKPAASGSSAEEQSFVEATLSVCRCIDSGEVAGSLLVVGPRGDETLGSNPDAGVGCD